MKKNIKKIIIILIGFFWILVILYRYLILQRETFILQPTGNLSYKLVLFLMLLINIILLFFNKNGKFKEFITKVINYIYWKPLLYIFENIFKDIDGTGDVLLWLSARIIDIYKILKLNFKRVMAWLLFILPKIILALFYFIDIFYFNQLFYFF